MAKFTCTKEQLNKFEKKAEEFDSENDLLVGLKAVKIDKGVWTVLRYEGLKGRSDPVTGIIFQNEFPFSLYQNMLDELKKKDKRKKYAKKKEEEHLEQTALSL